VRYGTDGGVRFTNLRLAAPRLRVTGGQGSYAPNGQIQISARANSTVYGPVGVKLAGTISVPRAVVTGARPGLGIGLANLVAGGIDLEFDKRSGIDLSNEMRPRFPTRDYKSYYNRLFGANWSNSEILNLSIGQGANSQTVATMAKFYTALANEGTSSTPELVAKEPEKKKIINLTPEQYAGLRRAMAGVTSAGGTAASANIQGLVIAGKTGSAQNAQNRNKDHAWFVGFAPADDPKIVVAVFLEFGEHGWSAARVASRIMGFYTGKLPAEVVVTE
jgi:cell division protein FtsI/penicillin-binding protein 2